MSVFLHENFSIFWMKWAQQYQIDTYQLSRNVREKNGLSQRNNDIVSESPFLY